MLPPDLPDYLTSPGSATSHQAREESRLEAALLRRAQGFLEEIRMQALSYNLTPASAREGWDEAVAATLGELDYTLEAGDYLRDALEEVALGSEAYDAAMIVLATANQTWPAPSSEEIEQALDEALSLDTQSLVASGIVDKLTKVGNTWRTRIKRAVRTGFTGLMGVTAERALRVYGIPNKKWVTRHDDDVRPTHAAVDGTTVPLDAPFLVGGASLMYPGDRSGPIQEVANCRCIIIGAP